MEKNTYLLELYSGNLYKRNEIENGFIAVHLKLRNDN